MIQLIYTIRPENKEKEIRWLHDQKIYPGIQNDFDWRENKPVVKIAVIVVPETATLIKLRHKLDIQDTWTRK